MAGFYISLSVSEAKSALDREIVDGSITGELIDDYTISSPGGTCRVLVYEKHFYRAGNRLTLTVVLDDLAGRTRVHSIGGGGGEGLFRFDWGASASFENAVEKALSPYRI